MLILMFSRRDAFFLSPVICYERLSGARFPYRFVGEVQGQGTRVFVAYPTGYERSELTVPWRVWMLMGLVEPRGGSPDLGRQGVCWPL